MYRILSSARRDLQIDPPFATADAGGDGGDSNNGDNDSGKGESHLPLLDDGGPSSPSAKENAIRGLLIYGGHDQLAKALSFSIASTLRVPCLHVESHDIWKPYLGESEAAVRKIFSAARLLAPCVLFIEGVEAMAMTRDNDTDGGGIHARVLSAILGEMDGINRVGGGPVLVIGCTSRPWLLDSAMLRPGRFDRHFHLTPNVEQAAKEVSPFSLGLKAEVMLDAAEWDFAGFLVPRTRPLARTKSDGDALEDLHNRGVRWLNLDRLETMRS